MTGRKPSERVVAAVVVAVYLWACSSEVVCAGLSAGPFNMSEMSGVQCLLMGWMDYPFGWLANPIIWAGCILLLCGRPGASSLCGLLAVVPAFQWSLQWNQQGLLGTLRAGYYLWLASIGLLIVGGSVVWVAPTLRRQGRHFATLQKT